MTPAAVNSGACVDLFGLRSNLVPVANFAASAPPLSQSLDATHQQQQNHKPLPPGWEVLVDSSGRPYYGNPTLRITQYQHPGVQAAHASSPYLLEAQQPPNFQLRQHDAARMSIGSSQIELQEMRSTAQGSHGNSPQLQWQRCTDAYGRCYSLNTTTGETRWEYGN